MRFRPLLVSLVLAISAAVAGFLAGQRFPVQTTVEAGKDPESTLLTGIADAAHGSPAGSPGSHGKSTPDNTNAPRGNTPSLRLVQTLEELAAAKRRGDVEHLLATWLARNPEEVLRFLQSSPHRDDLLRKAATAWAATDAVGASTWLAAHPSVAGRDAMAAGLAAAVAGDEPDAAIQWVASIKDPLQKLAGARGAGYEFFRTSDDTALAALSKMGMPASSLDPELLEAWKRSLDEKSRRGAQNIASAYAAAKAAGAASSATDADAAIQEITNGLNGSGAFSTSVFKVNLDPWTAREQAATRDYLKFEGQSLLYSGQ